MILPEADLAAAIPRRQFASLDAALTFPARQYSVNGEKRSFTLLRPIADTAAQERIRDLVLEAYAEYDQTAANA